MKYGSSFWFVKKKAISKSVKYSKNKVLIYDKFLCMLESDTLFSFEEEFVVDSDDDYLANDLYKNKY